MTKFILLLFATIVAVPTTLFAQNDSPASWLLNEYSPFIKTSVVHQRSKWDVSPGQGATPISGNNVKASISTFSLSAGIAKWDGFSIHGKLGLGIADIGIVGSDESTGKFGLGFGALFSWTHLFGKPSNQTETRADRALLAWGIELGSALEWSAYSGFEFSDGKRYTLTYPVIDPFGKAFLVYPIDDLLLRPHAGISLHVENPRFESGASLVSGPSDTIDLDHKNIVTISTGLDVFIDRIVFGLDLRFLSETSITLSVGLFF